jgi:hypothetical protein
MKKFILLFGVLSLTLILQAQPWPRIIGTGYNEDSRQIIEHYDKGYLITSLRYLGTVQKGLLVKTDINGEVLWEKEVGVPPDIVFTDKTLYDEDGNIYTFGCMVQDTQHEWPYIAKLNACGELIWCKKIIDYDYEFGYFTDAILLDNGDLLGLAYIDKSPQYDIIHLICLSPQGEYKWKKVYASCDNYPDFAVRMGYSLKKFNNTYIISGYVYSPYPGGDPEHVWMRPMFIGVDAEFKEKWVLEYGICDSLLGIAYSTTQINDTIFMGVGKNRYVKDGINTHRSFLMFYNDKGEELKHHLIDGSEIDTNIIQNFIFDIEKIENDKYVCAMGIGEVYQGGNCGDMIIDTAGNVYDYRVRENSTGGGFYMVKTFDNKYVIACNQLTTATNYDMMLYKTNENLEYDTLYPGNYTYDSLCPYPIESGVIDLTGCDVVTSIEEIPTLEQYRENLQSISITASPNPTSSGEVLLELENTASFTNMELHVTDVYGKKIHTESILPQQGAVRLKTGQWPAGMYVVTIMSNGDVKGKAKFVVR